MPKKSLSMMHRLNMSYHIVSYLIFFVFHVLCFLEQIIIFNVKGTVTILDRWGR